MRLIRPGMVWAPWRSSESWPLNRVDDRFDPLTDAAEAAEAARFVFAVRAQEDRAELGHQPFELLAGEALVGDHGVTLEVDAFEHLGGDPRSGTLAGASSNAIGIPSLAHSR